MTKYVFLNLIPKVILTAVFYEVIDELEPLVSTGGVILDWHSCELFPERWIDLVVVLRCDHTKLWERLEKRLEVTQELFGLIS